MKPSSQLTSSVHRETTSVKSCANEAGATVGQGCQPGTVGKAVGGQVSPAFDGNGDGVIVGVGVGVVVGMGVGAGVGAPRRVGAGVEGVGAGGNDVREPLCFSCCETA